MVRCSMDATEEPVSRSIPHCGRLVNHGQKRERNCVMKVMDINGIPKLCLFASGEISAGMEILYDYGIKVPWESEVNMSHVISKFINVIYSL